MYFFSNSINASFEATVLATKDALKRHGFEVLAEIDMRKAFRKHLAGDFRPYLILIAYDPTSARRAVQIFDKIGSNLLCNVVVQQQNDNRVDVSVVNPAKTMYVINHVELDWIIRDLRGHLQKAIEEIEIRSEARLHARDEAVRVNYVVDGYDIGFQAEPYSVDAANNHSRDISGYDRVCDCYVADKRDHSDRSSNFSESDALPVVIGSDPKTGAERVNDFDIARFGI
jgi:uncharacterized protein (DUF302 family)